jgi:PAS domain S-box-containing protein
MDTSFLYMDHILNTIFPTVVIKNEFLQHNHKTFQNQFFLSDNKSNMTMENKPVPINIEDKVILAKLLAAVPYLFFIVSITLTFFVWKNEREELQQKIESRFNEKTTEIKEHIRSRLKDHEKLLLGGVGLFNSKEEVTQADWRQYVSSLQIDQNYPGTQGMGYSAWVPANQKLLVTKNIRDQGFPDFTIRPEGNRGIYTTIIFLEPFNWRNQRAFGYDMYTESNRKIAMDTAKDSGIASLSNKIILLQETEKEKQNGFLMYLPVYQKGKMIDTLLNRRNSIKGFVYGPIRVNNFIHETIAGIDNNITFEIYDEGLGAIQDKLLYSKTNAEKIIFPAAYKSRFSKFENVDIFNGHRWKLIYKSMPLFDKQMDSASIDYIIFSGLAVSLLMSYVLLISLNSRKKVKDALKKSEERFSTIFNNSPDAYMILEKENGLITDCNFATEVMLRGARHQIIGKTPDQLSPTFQPDGRRSSEAAMERVTESIKDGKHHFEWLHTRLDGTEFWAEVNISTFILTERLVLLVAWRDITERNKNKLKLEKAITEAETANLAKSRFLATMSHEIRTPMNGILGMAQLLMMPNLNEAERQDYTKVILNSGNTLLRLLNDILDLSKIEANKVQIESISSSPEQIIHDVKTLFKESAIRKNISLESEWMGNAGKNYLTDPNRLRQMLSNLTSNAIKFTHSGSIKISARVLDNNSENNSNDKLLEFSVQDTGIGIPDDKLSLIFQPFSQSDNTITRKYGGTGLGLSIVSGLAKTMGGDVGLESILNQGSRFWFTVRVGNITSEEQSYNKPDHHTSNKNLKQLSGNVLVVDDDPINRLVISAILKKLGLSVLQAENGQQALDLFIYGATIDLILMDMQMPIMDGNTATKLIRSREKENDSGHQLIIALTANAYAEDNKLCIEAGMDEILIKPINIEKLSEVLYKYLS